MHMQVLYIQKCVKCVSFYAPPPRKVTERRAMTTWWWTSPTRYNSLAGYRLLCNPIRKKHHSVWLSNLCAHSPQDPASPRGSPAHSPRENGLDKRRLLKKDAPLSPSSIASSSSTPSSKSKEINLVSHLGNYSPLIFFLIVSLGSFSNFTPSW